MVSAQTLATFAKNLVDAMKNVFIQKSDKVNSWSESVSNDKVPSEKLVKDSLDEKIDLSSTAGLVKNDGTIDTNTYLTEHQSLDDYIEKTDTDEGFVRSDGSIDNNTYLTQHQSLTNYVQKSDTVGLIKNDGTIDTNTYLTQHQSLSDYVEKSDTPGLIKNDGTIDTNTYLTQHQSLEDYIEKSETPGLVKNDGTIDTTTYLSQHQDISGKANSADLATVATSGDYSDLSNTPDLTDVVRTSSTAGLIKNDGTIDSNVYLTEHQSISGKEDKTNKVTTWSSTTTDEHYPSESLVKNSLDGKADISDVPTAVSDLTNDLGFLTQHQSLDSKTVTVEKQSSAETGYAATYVVKQNGSQVGSKINIPKDFLVKDAGMSTVSSADTPVTGYAVGDKYLWFKINTVENDGTDDYIYILVSDLIDTYTADETTIELSNNEFAVKAGGITTTELSTGVNTSLGYADAWNSSAAKNITSTDISNWNAKGSSNITTADIDSEIESYLTAIISELNGE